MGRRSINTTKSGKFMNPTDQFRKEARKRELKKNKKQRTLVRTAVLKGKDPLKLLEEMEIIDRMEYNPMQPPSLNEKVLREKRKKLRETYDRVFKLYEKERPEFAVELRKANSEYEKRRNQMQLLYDQVRNAERVQLDQIPLPEAMGDPDAPGAIPLPTDLPMHMIPGMPMPLGGQYPMFQPHSILKKTSAYGGPLGAGPHIPAHMMKSNRRKPPGPPPGPPPALSDSEGEDITDEPRDVDYRLNQDIDERVDRQMRHRDDIDDTSRHEEEKHSKSRRIRFADDDYDDRSRDSEEEERRERRRERKEKKKKRREEERAAKSNRGSKKVSALQAMMLKMAGQEVPGEEEGEDERRSGSSSSSSSSSSEDEDDRRRERREEDRHINTKDREIERRRREISKLDDRPPGLEDPADRLTEEEAAALAAARLIEEAEEEAETRGEDGGEGGTNAGASTPRLNPPGPPPGLPAGLAGLPPGPPPGAPPMFMRPPPLRGAPMRLMPPGPPPGRPQGLPPGPPPGLPSNIRGMRIPIPVGMPPLRMIRLPGGPPGMLPPGLPPPQQTLGSILTAPPSIRLREDGESGGQSRVTIQAKPQIKSKMGDVTRFMPTALKVKRETRDQKGRLRTTGKEEEPRMIGAQAMPQPAPAAQTRTKDDAYDQFMKEMEGLI